MTQEEKQLLLKDLCSRLPYGVICKFSAKLSAKGANISITEKLETGGLEHFIFGIMEVLPYLRPMSSMTTEEWCEYCDSCVEDEKEVIFTHKGYRIVPTTHKEHFFNSHHFDYRSLIEKGLALEAPEGMYKED